MASTGKFVQSPPKVVFLQQNSLDLPVVENVSCVFPQTSQLGGLYIGNYMGAQNVDLLCERGIRCVLTASVQTPIVYPIEQIPFHKRIEAHDRQNFSILDHFDECLQFIEKCRKVTSVYVHCYAGVSRSASIVLAYIMKSQKWTYETALNFLKYKRVVVNPNEGFAAQLKEFERRIAVVNRANSSSSSIPGVVAKPRTPAPLVEQKKEVVPVYQPTPLTANIANRPPLPRLPPSSPTKPNDSIKKISQDSSRSMSNQASNTTPLNFKPPTRTVTPNLTNISLSHLKNDKDIGVHTPLQTPVERKHSFHENTKSTAMLKKVQVNHQIKTPTKTSLTTPQKQSPEDDDRIQASVNARKFVRPKDLPGYRLN